MKHSFHTTALLFNDTLKIFFLIILFGFTSLANANTIDYLYYMAGNPTKGMKTLTIERDNTTEIYYLNTEAKFDSVRFRGRWREEFMAFQYRKDTLTINMYANGKLEGKMLWTKDSVWSYGYEKDSVKLIMSAQLDDHGEIKSQYRDGIGTDTYKRIYDSKGNCTRKEYYEKGVKKQVTVAKYDDRGIIMEKREFDAQGKQKYCNKYNSNGLLVEYDEDGKVYFRTYKYDEKGNWIEFTVVEKSNPQAIVSTVKRVIEYY